MIEHLAALKARIEPLGFTVHTVVAPPSAPPPYVLIWPSTGALEGAAVDDVRTDLSVIVGVSAVGTSPDSAMVVAMRTRNTLTPTGLGTLDVSLRRVWLRHMESRPLFVDRDVTLTATNAHPVVAVDLYRLTSTSL